MRGFCLFVLTVCPLVLSAQDVTDLLPREADLPGWTVASAPRLFVGDSLFDFIDGGAAIYHEYGFRQTLALQYVDPGGRLLSAEIYEMEDPAAAFGIFSFQRGDGARPLALGDSGVIGAYYASFWKDRFLVTVSGQDTSEQAGVSLKLMARRIEGRIPGKSAPPPIVQRLMRVNLGWEQLVYVRGYLGLVNQYDFGASDPFATGEGCVAVYDSVKCVVLQFEDDPKAAGAFAAAESLLVRVPRFSSFQSTTDALRCIDREGSHLTMATRGRYVIAAIARQDEAAESALRRMSSLF